MELLKRVLTFSLLLMCVFPVWGGGDPILGLDFFQKHRGCKVEKDFLYLNKEKKTYFENKLGNSLDSSILKRYKLICGIKEGSVYVLGSLVRSHYMSLLVYALDDRINDIEVVHFKEPVEYRPKENWLRSVLGLSFSSNIKIDGMSGATLTTQTTKNLLNQVKIMENDFHDKN